MRERELKLALPGRFSLPPLTLDGRTLDATPLPDLDMRATYFDTSDLRLARHGVTLRYRTGEQGVPSWTLKLSAGAHAGELSRDEVHFDGLRRDPPAQARSLVTAYARAAELSAVATLRTKRRRWRLADGDDEMAEVADDEVSVLEGRRVVSRFRELEVEARSEDAPIGRLAEQLRRAGAIDADPIPKVVRALGSRATAPPDARFSVPEDATMADALACAVADALQRLMANDPLARLGLVEGVHQLRVSLRRLRSDLATMEPFVEPIWHARIEPELRRIGRAVGAVRDLDVLIGRFRKDLSDAGDSLDPLLAELDARRATAHATMTEALDGAAYAELLDELVRAVERPPATAAAEKSARESLPNLVRDAWSALERRATALKAGSEEERFHRTRIEVKRTRYAAELASRFMAPRRAAAEKLSARLASAQDQLGVIQDAAVAESVVRDEVGRTIIDPQAALQAGILLERGRGRANAARGDFLAGWNDLRRRKWRRWLEA